MNELILCTVLGTVGCLLYFAGYVRGHYDSREFLKKIRQAMDE
jgi:hypothetical protein